MITTTHINLDQRAARWVSVFVLLGCIAITGVLVFAAYKAEAFGDHISNKFSEAYNY